MVSQERSLRKYLINGQFLFFILVIGTAYFAWYQYQQAEQQKQAEAKKDLIFSDWKIQEVQEIQIQSGKAEKNTHLIRAPNSQWHLQTPLKDLASASVVLEWIESVLAEKGTILKLRKSEENTSTDSVINWSEYGLADNVRTIELKSKSKNMRLLISHYSAFDGSFFIRKGEQLLLGSKAWAQLSEKPIDLFRSYQLLNIPEHPLSLIYKSKNFRFHLNWEQHDWKWSKNTPTKKQFILSQTQLESYWSALSKIQFQKTDIYPKTKHNQKKYGLLNPSIQLSFQFKQPTGKWIAKFSKKNNLFYVSISTRNYIFTLKPDQIDKILLTEMKIRNHQKPFKVNPNQVQLIELKSKNINLNFKREKNKWILLTKLQAPTEKHSNNNKERKLLKVISKEPVTRTLNRISELSVNKYVHNIKNFKPTSSLVLRDKDKKQLLQLQFSTVFKKDDLEQVYVLSSAGKDMMLIPAEDFKDIFLPKVDDEEDEK